MTLPVIAHCLKKWKNPPEIELIEKELFVTVGDKTALVVATNEDEDRFIVALTDGKEEGKEIEGTEHVVAFLMQTFQ